MLAEQELKTPLSAYAEPWSPGNGSQTSSLPPGPGPVQLPPGHLSLSWSSCMAWYLGPPQGGPRGSFILRKLGPRADGGPSGPGSEPFLGLPTAASAVRGTHYTGGQRRRVRIARAVCQALPTPPSAFRCFLICKTGKPVLPLHPLLSQSSLGCPHMQTPGKGGGPKVIPNPGHQASRL